LLFVVAGLFFLNPKAFALGAYPSTGAFSQSVLLLIYAFSGFEMAAVPAGEIRNPQKYLPRALLLAMAVVATLYILIQVVCIGTLPDLATSQKPLADAGLRFMGSIGARVIAAGAIISIMGNLNIVLLAGSRIPFAIAEEKQLPSLLARLNRRSFTPHASILITASLMMVLTLRSSFVSALTISAIARLVTYAVTCAALPVLRRRKGSPAPMFRVRGGPVIACAALILAAWLLLNSARSEAVTAAIAALVGLLIYAGYRLYLARVSQSPTGES
jgi:amino acid transporter